MPSFGIRRGARRRRRGARCWSRSRRTAASARRRRAPAPASSSSVAEERVVDRDASASAPSAQRRASRRRCPTTTCCGTRPSGSTCSVSASGPALVTRTVISRSVGVGLGVVDLDDPVAVVVEHAGVEQLVLGVELAAPAVLGEQVVVGERRLRVVVAPAVPGVARHGVEVPPVLLDVLAVVALGAGQAEHPLLEDRVAAVPQRQAEAQPLLDVGEAGHAVLAPAVGPRPGVVVGEVRPRPRRRRCSPRAPCPTGARSRTGPTGTSRRPGAARSRGCRTTRPAPARRSSSVRPLPHPRRSSRWSPTRRALAMIVSVGFTAPIEAKKLASTT